MAMIDTRAEPVPHVPIFEAPKEDPTENSAASVLGEPTPLNDYSWERDHATSQRIQALGSALQFKGKKATANDVVEFATTFLKFIQG